MMSLGWIYYVRVDKITKKIIDVIVNQNGTKKKLNEGAKNKYQVSIDEKKKHTNGP